MNIFDRCWEISPPLTFNHEAYVVGTKYHGGGYMVARADTGSLICSRTFKTYSDAISYLEHWG